MAAVADAHHTWAFAFGILGNLISFMVYLAPMPTFYRIYKKKSTEGFQSVPYLVALFSSTLWLYYAMLKQNAVLLITINTFGSVIETLYIAMYIVYATKASRKFTIKLFGMMNLGLFSLILLIRNTIVVQKFTIKLFGMMNLGLFSLILVILQYALHTDPFRAVVLGWINVAIFVCVFAAPLSIVAQVIRTKSVEFMPFTLSFFLTLSAVMWFAYGLFLKDICIALPNVLGFILGLLQMLLYAIYRNRKQLVVDPENKVVPVPEPMKCIVVLSTKPSDDNDVVEGENVDVKDGRKEGEAGGDDQHGKVVEEPCVV